MEAKTANHSLRSLATIWILIAAYGLLFLSWALSKPAAVAADETAHYLRAAGVARGQWILPKPPPLTKEEKAELEGGEIRAQTQKRVVTLPVSMSPESLRCRSIPFTIKCPEPFTVRGSEQVDFQTNMGTTQPFSYVVPGLGTLFSERVVPSLLMGRLTVALFSTILVAAAALALWQGGRAAISMIGLLAALTPMLMSVGGSLTASGPEVVAGVGFFACLLRLARFDHPPRWLWGALAVSGFVLAATRDLGPFFLAMQLILFLGLLGFRPTIETFRSNLKPALATSAVVAAGLLLNVWWQLNHEPHPPTSPDVLSKFYDPSWGNLRDIGRESIGVFGPLDTTLNAGAYFGWTFLLISLATLSFLVGTRRHRLLLAAAVAFSVVSILALETVQRSVGFGAQGRQLLPILVVMPLLSGEIVYLNRMKLAQMRPRLVRWFAIACGVLHAWAWYTVSRRYAVGPGGDNLFYRDPYFVPPLGWLIWGFVVLTACLLIGGFGLMARDDWAGAAEVDAEHSSARSG